MDLQTPHERLVNHYFFLAPFLFYCHYQKKHLAPRLTMGYHIRQHWSHKVFELIVFFVIVLLVAIGISQYRELAYAQNPTPKSTNFWQDVKGVLSDPCTKVTGKNCSQENEEPPQTPSQKIHLSYPQSAQGKEIIYPLLDKGDITIADKMLVGYDGVSPRFNISL